MPRSLPYAKWTQEEKDRQKAYTKAWKQNNKDKVRMHNLSPEYHERELNGMNRMNKYYAEARKIRVISIDA